MLEVVNLPDSGKFLSNKLYHLLAIHRAPRPAWQPLVEHLVKSIREELADAEGRELPEKVRRRNGESYPYRASTSSPTVADKVDASEDDTTSEEESWGSIPTVVGRTDTLR